MPGYRPHRVRSRRASNAFGAPEPWRGLCGPCRRCQREGGARGRAGPRRGIAEAEDEEPHASVSTRLPSRAIPFARTSWSVLRRRFTAASRDPAGRKPRRRPDRHGADQRRRIVEQTDAPPPARMRLARIPDRDQDIADESVTPRPLHGGSGKPAPERRVVEARQFGERAGRKSSRWPEPGLAAGLGELVPGADRKTIVAAEDPVADAGAQFGGDVVLVLDGQIGDAAPGIEPVGRRESVGRADCRGSAGRTRNGRAPVRPAEARPWCRLRRGTASSRTRARPAPCACPASRGRPPPRAAFPSRARYRRTP